MPLTLDDLRAAHTADITLGSGLEITGTLPRIRDCLIAGDIPLPVLAEIEAEQKDAADDAPPPDLTPDKLRAVAAYNDALVMAFVTAVGGVPVSLTKDDLALFTEDDFNECVAYASRATPLPGKG